jgi:signal transduction histidine kinase
MGNNLNAISNILTTSPGYLIYHLGTSFALLVTAIICAAHINDPRRGQRARHVLLGSGVLLTLQLLLFSSYNLANVKVFNTTLLYPIIERAVALLTIIWIIWTFVESDKEFLMTSSVILISLTGLFLGVATIIFLNLQPQITTFSNTGIDISWQILSAVFIAIGMIIILTSNAKNKWGGIIILTILMTGHILQIVIANSATDLCGAVRMAQTLALPLLLILTQPFGTPKVKSLAKTNQEKIELQEKPIDTKPKLMNFLLNISLQESPEERFKAVVRAISLSVVADICYLVHMPNDIGEIKVDAGYDLIREEFLRPASLQRGQIPLIINAWEENNILELPSNYSGTPDVVTLYELIQYHRIGNLLAFPLSMPDQPVVGGLIFLSPYTVKEWNQKTFEILNEIKANLARIFYAANQDNSFKNELEETQVLLNITKDEKSLLEKNLNQKKIRIEDLETEVKRLKAKNQMEKMESVKQIETLKKKVNTLTAQNASQQKTRAKLEQMTERIRQLVREREQLKTGLKRAAAKIKHLESYAGQTGPTRLTTNNQVIRLEAFARQIKSTYQDATHRQSLNFEIHNPDSQQKIKIDTELLHKVIGGLVENAIYASPIGGSIQLRMNLSMETGMLIVQMTDLGEGLTQEEQTALFSANNEVVPGIGSVQAIRNVARAIRILNGKIWLRSKKGQFTTFRVQLPVRILD